MTDGVSAEYEEGLQGLVVYFYFAFSPVVLDPGVSWSSAVNRWDSQKDF